MSAAAFAQAEEPSVTNEWTVKIVRTDVVPAEFEYKMNPGEVQIGGQAVYSVTTPLTVVGSNKPAKYAITVSGFSTDGTPQSASQQIRLHEPAGPMSVTVSASAVSNAIRVAPTYRNRNTGRQELISELIKAIG